MSKPKPKVLLLGQVLHAHEAWSQLEPKVEVIKPQATTREGFIEECGSGALDGILALYRASVTVAGKFDEELVKALPQSLKFVCYTGAGYDSIDAQACTNAGIQVSNVRAAVDDATADTAVFLMLGCLRMFGPHISAMRSGGWMADCPMGRDPRGLTLGVLGMGGIGKAVGRRVEQMGMKLQYHNRSKIQEEGFPYDYVGFDELLATSDVLLLSLPLNDKTYHIISQDAFKKMKDDIVVINTARGGVMDEQALVDALESGKVWSAGLDVFEHEPKVHPKLIENHRCMLVPHVGTYTRGARRQMEEWAISNLASVVENGTLKNRVPEQVGVDFGF